MKATFYSIFLTICFCISAQEDFLVTLENDTLYGKVSILDDDYLEGARVKSDDGEKEEFRAYQVLTLFIDGNLHDPVIYDSKRVFGQRIVKGDPLSFYRIRTDGSYYYNQPILVKKSGEHFFVPNLTFKKQIVEFLRDCESVTDKIDNNELAKNDLEEIVNLYNSQCSSSNSKKPKPINKTKKPESSKLSDLASLIRDIQEKKKNGESSPSYMLKALEEYKSQDLGTLIEAFLEDQ